MAVTLGVCLPSPVRSDLKIVKAVTGCTNRSRTAAGDRG